MDVQRRDSRSTFCIFSPLLFILKSLGGSLRQPNSPVANTPCTCTCVKDSKSKKQALVKWDDKHHHWQLSHAGLVWLLWYRDHSVSWSSSFISFPLLTQSLFQLPQSPKSTSSSAVVVVFLGMRTKRVFLCVLLAESCGFSFKLTEDVVHCLMALQWV